MARINAGSTLANQYAPPFVVADNVATGWELQWNETIQAFEAYDPSGNVVETGFDSIDVAFFAGVTQQTFVVPWETVSKQSLIITIQGVKQQQTAYSYTSDSASGTTTVTLDSSVSNEDVEILGLQTSGGASTEIYGPVPVDLDVPNTAQVDFDLGWLAPSVQSLIVTIDGVKQATNAYSILPINSATDTTLTFTESPIMTISDTAIVSGGTGYNIGDVIEIVGGTGTLAQYTVTAEVGNVITGVSINNPVIGLYTVFPTGVVTTTTISGGGASATFTLTKDSQEIEVVGILTAGETPASPVTVINLDGSALGRAEIFSAKRLSADTQIFDFRDLSPGTGVTLDETANSITINATQTAYSEVGGGTLSLIEGLLTADPLVFRRIAPGDGIAVSAPAGVLTIANSGTYEAISATPITIAVSSRIIGVRHTITAPVVLELPTIASFFVGETITIKDEGRNAGTNNITISPNAADGAAMIETTPGTLGASYVANTNGGYVTLYTDGTNFIITAEG